MIFPFSSPILFKFQFFALTTRWLFFLQQNYKIVLIYYLSICRFEQIMTTNELPSRPKN